MRAPTRVTCAEALRAHLHLHAEQRRLPAEFPDLLRKPYICVARNSSHFLSKQGGWLPAVPHQAGIQFALSNRSDTRCQCPDEDTAWPINVHSR